jgi:hypothetical protein
MLVAHPVSQVWPILPDSPINVANWSEDEQWANYPEGARPKSAYFPPAEPLPDFIKPERRYLFKRSQRRYPEQFWAEVVAYHIGCLLDVDVPPAYPAINSATGECAALIEWFYEDGKALFEMGGHFMQQIIKDFDRVRGGQHNFHAINVLFRALQRDGLVTPDWGEEWAKMLMFDALCGNTDRHQDNWGIVFDLATKPPVGRLSPCYDNGTSLGHELWEEYQGKKWNDDRWLKYINNGMHHMRWTLEAPQREGHVSGVQKLAVLFPALRSLMHARLTAFDMLTLRDTLKKMSAIAMPIRLTPWRTDLIYRLVNTRRSLLLSALQ